MGNEILTTLVDATWAVSAGILLVLLLRWPLRRLFGAALAYQAWVLVPLVTATAFLPPLQVQRRPAVVVLLHPTAMAAPVAEASFIPWTSLGLLVWALGAALLALWFWRAHADFVRRLGALVAQGGLYVCQSPDAGPALLGLVRPRIVVPADFATRYTRHEQELIVEHERVHARRRDMLANLFQACLQCVFWFNPLVHAAALFFRTDQELACDAAVVRKHPGALRTYAQALLKSNTFSTAAPATVACSWRFNHPVKERLMSLQQTQPSHARRVTGRLIVITLICAAGYGALLARAGEASASGATWYKVAMSLKAQGMESSPRVITRAGEAFTVRREQDGATWSAEFVVTKAGPADHTVKLVGTIKDETRILSRPTLLARLGVPATIRVDRGDGKGFELSMVVTEAVPGDSKQ